MVKLVLNSGEVLDIKEDSESIDRRIQISSFNKLPHIILTMRETGLLKEEKARIFINSISHYHNIRGNEKNKSNIHV